MTAWGVGVLALVVCGMPAVAHAVPIVRAVEVGDRVVTLTWDPVPGDTLDFQERVTMPGMGFGRYQVWRSETPNPDDFALLRSYSVFDSTWTTFAGSRSRSFRDPDSILPRGVNPRDFERIEGPFNGFIYYYAVTWDEAYYDSSSGIGRPAFVNRVGIEEGMWPEAILPGAEARVQNPLLSGVSVVPNPYNPSGFAGQQAFPGPPRVQFRNLPERCTIQVFTVDGGLVRILEHESSIGNADWDLKNDDGRDVASGIYLYHIRSGDQETRGRFVIIR